MDEKVQYVFPEVLKYRETKEAAAQTAAEAKRRGMTVSEFVRSSMRETLGLPPPPTIEKRQGKPGLEPEAKPGLQVPDEVRRSILRDFETACGQVGYERGESGPGVWKEAWERVERRARNTTQRDALLAAFAKIRSEQEAVK